jgi:hypothetical protein
MTQCNMSKGKRVAHLEGWAVGHSGVVLYQPYQFYLPAVPH